MSGPADSYDRRCSVVPLMPALIMDAVLSGPPIMPRPEAGAPPMTPLPAAALRLATGGFAARPIPEDGRRIAGSAVMGLMPPTAPMAVPGLRIRYAWVTAPIAGFET